MRNRAMRHAFEALPQSVLSTPIGRMVFRVLQRNATNAMRRKASKK